MGNGRPHLYYCCIHIVKSRPRSNRTAEYGTTIAKANRSQLKRCGDGTLLFERVPYLLMLCRQCDQQLACTQSNLQPMVASRKRRNGYFEGWTLQLASQPNRSCELLRLPMRPPSAANHFASVHCE